MCFIGCVAVFLPRLAIVLVLLFEHRYLLAPIDPWWLVVPGFLFLPYTTLAYAFAVNTVAPIGDVGPLGWVIVLVAILVDLGHLGGGARYGARRRERTA